MEKPRNQVQDLKAVLALAKELLSLEGQDELLESIVRGSLEILGGSRGFLVLASQENLEFKVVKNFSQEEFDGGREPVSRSIVAEVLTYGKPILIEDALSDPRFHQKESVQNLFIRSILAAPLRAEGAIVGALYLESNHIQEFFGPKEFELFCQILELSSSALEAGTKLLLLSQRNSLLERDLSARYRFPGIISRDPGFLQLLETVAQVASSHLPVLIQGPSGTGKELIARALHLNSPRTSRPFLTINCGAISPNLLESELFGHVKGAFTGALQNKLGLVAAAHQGTLFLDEVSELPKELQVKLLRTLQFGEVQPVGSTRAQIFDVRFLAATNRNLEEEVEEGRFREDLFYRLNVIPLYLPKLKDRPGDILPLFYYFLQDGALKAKRPTPEVSPLLERALEEHTWPGNIRELENEALRLIAMTPPNVPLTPERLSQRISTKPAPPPEITAPLLSFAEHEKELIMRHLQAARGNRTHAAQSLGVTREGLRRMMRRYNLLDEF